MNKEQAHKRLDAIEREAKELREIIEAEDKPLTWPELPDGACFLWGSENFDYASCLKYKMGNRCGTIYQDGRVLTPFFDHSKGDPVTRVTLDGAPYEGDPRK